MIPYSLEDLLPLMKEQVRKYTSNESTSVPYSTAQNIMESILYSIDAAYQTLNDTQLTTGLLKEPFTPRQAYQFGFDLLRKKLTATQIYFDSIKQNFCGYQNLCYQDTIIKGIPAFFERYDLIYDATHSIITLDYPLLKEDRNLTGIHLIYDYLLKTQLEQNFLHLFSPKNIEHLLYSYDNHFHENIFNLCRIVLTNVLGCLITNNPTNNLFIDDPARDMIYKFSDSYSQEELELILLNKLELFVQYNYSNANDLLNYFSSSVKDITYEIKFYNKNQCLQQLFPQKSPSHLPAEQSYTDGENMEDEKLRNLIEEMSSIRYISDKILLVQQQVKSLSDLKEILKECFFSREWTFIFPLLSTMEKNILLEEIQEKFAFDGNLEDWEISFIEYCKKE